MSGKININNYEAFLLDYAEGRLKRGEINELKQFLLNHPQLDQISELLNTALPAIEPEELPIPGRQELKKDESGFPAEEILLYLEGLMSPQEKNRFELKLTSDSFLAAETEKFRQTYLQPESDEKFKWKNDPIKTEEDLLLNNKALAYTEGLLSGEELLEFNKQLKQNVGLNTEVKQLEQLKLQADQAIVFPDKEKLKKKSRIITLYAYRAVAAVLVAVAGTWLFFGIRNNTLEPAVTAEVKTKAPVNHSASSSKSLAAKAEMPAVKKSKASPVNTAGSEQPRSVLKKQDLPVVSQVLAQNKTLLPLSKDSTGKGPAEPLLAVEEKRENEKPVIPAGTVVASASQNTVTVSDSEMLIPVNQLAEVSDDEDAEAPAETKTSFWKRTLKLARNANSLGFKAINVEESDNSRTLLSFNAVSIEKK